MDKLITIWSFICRRKYLITVVAFAVIIGFLDENSLFRRLAYEREISQLKEEIEKYRADYEENTKRLNELNSNPDAIEQVAREKYLMKKPNEDIYVFKIINETISTCTFRRRRNYGSHRSCCIYHRMELCSLYLYHRSRIHRIGTSKHAG